MRKINLDEADTKLMKTGVSPSQVDAVMRKVSEQLGETWQCSRYSGIWHFFHKDENGKVIKNVPSRRRNFTQALSDATEASIVIAISL